MKSTLRNILHSPRFMVGFVIFMTMVLTVLIYPYFVPRNPLLSLGKGFLPPGTYFSVYDANNAPTFRVELPEADTNRLQNDLPQSDRKLMLDFLKAKGVDTSGLSSGNDKIADLLEAWKANYDEADVKSSKYEGFTTQAKRRALAKLDKKLNDFLSNASMKVIRGEGEDLQ